MRISPNKSASGLREDFTETIKVVIPTATESGLQAKQKYALHVLRYRTVSATCEAFINKFNADIRLKHACIARLSAFINKFNAAILANLSRQILQNTLNSAAISPLFGVPRRPLCKQKPA